MKQKKLVSSPYILRSFGGDLSKKWYWERYDESGRRVKKYGKINSFPTVDERHEEAESFRVQLETGIVSIKPSFSVIFQHIDAHLKSHCEVLRGASVKDYTSVFAVFERWLLGNGYKLTHPKKFLRGDVEKFMRYIEIERAASNATYNKYVNVLDLLFSYLVEYDVIPKSPFAYIKRKSKNSTSVSAFKDDDVALLKPVLKSANTTVYVSCMISLYAFIRPKETRFLKIKHIDLVDNKIYIDKEFSKNKKSQHVVILPALHEILTEYLKNESNPDFYLLSKSGMPGIAQISSSYVVENHNKILSKKGFDIQKFKPYSWKHTGNSIAYKNGASIRFLKMQNRHHSEAMTEIYIKSIVPEDLVNEEAKFFNF